VPGTPQRRGGNVELSRSATLFEVMSASLMPSCRHTSPTAVPALAWLCAKATCSSENFDRVHPSC